MHHLDIHVSDLAAAKRLFDAIGPHVGLELRSDDPDFVSYWRGGKRPSIGLIPGEGAGSGLMRVAFAVADAAAVDAVAAEARKHGATQVDGPSIHSEYGDYYAVFFEDADGNKFEIVLDPEFA